MLNHPDCCLQALDEYFAFVHTHHHTHTEVRTLMATGCATVSDEGDSRSGRHNLRGRHPLGNFTALQACGDILYTHSLTHSLTHMYLCRVQLQLSLVPSRWT